MSDKLISKWNTPRTPNTILRREESGNYYSVNRRFFVEKCYTGYDVFQLNSDGLYEYIFSADTLWEVRKGCWYETTDLTR